MSDPFAIEPVLPTQYMDAMSFIISGSRRDFDTSARAGVLMDLARSRRPHEVHLWWARRQRATLASAMAVVNPGRAGMAFFSGLSLPGVEPAAVGLALRAASLAALDQDVTFIQAMIDPDQPPEEAALRAAGYDFLAELVYMRKELAGMPRPLDPAEAQWQWLCLGQFNEAQLADLIALTYRDSLDCPRLAGLRRMEDVIASHKSGGVFDRRHWWMALSGGRPAGCILVNDYPMLSSADVVYLGVVPEFRRRGLARVMLHRAARLAAGRGLSGMTLAVDAENARAVALYASGGYSATQRRRAYAILRAAPFTDRPSP